MLISFAMATPVCSGQKDRVKAYIERSIVEHGFDL